MITDTILNILDKKIVQLKFKLNDTFYDQIHAGQIKIFKKQISICENMINEITTFLSKRDPDFIKNPAGRLITCSLLEDLERCVNLKNMSTNYLNQLIEINNIER